MAKIKTLVQGTEYIAQYINAGTEQGIEFSLAGKSVNTDGDDLFWGTDKLLTEADQFELPVASASVLGGVKIGSGVNVDANGVISVEELSWDNITDKPTEFEPAPHDHVIADITNLVGLQSLSNSVTNFQNATQVQTAITTALGNLEFVKDVFVSDGTDAFVNGDLVVQYKDDSTVVLWNLVAETNISVVKGQDIIDINTNNSLGLDVSLVDPAGDYIVIDFGEPTMTWTELDIPLYTGDDGTTTRVQITVNSSNVISAVILSNAVGMSQLTQVVRDTIDSKISKKWNPAANGGLGGPTVPPGNIAVFDSNGDITDGDRDISSFAPASHTHEIEDINGLETVLEIIDETINGTDGILERLDTLENAIPDVAESTITLADNAASAALLPTTATSVKNLFQGLRNFQKYVLGLFNPATGHKHDGVDSALIDYNDLINVPENFMGSAETSVAAGTTDAYSFFAPAATVNGVNIEYIVTRGGDQQYGTIMLRKNKRYFIEKDVFGDEVGVIFGADTTVGSITIENTGVTSIDVKFVITYL